MTRTALVLLFMLTAAPDAFAQGNGELPGWQGPDPSLATFDLASLGIGTVIPWAIELDGNTKTTEWALLTGSGVYAFDLRTGCLSQITFKTPFDLDNKHTQWMWTLVQIAPNPRHQIMVWDADARDGKAPISVQPIVYERCH